MAKNAETLDKYQEPLHIHSPYLFILLLRFWTTKQITKEEHLIPHIPFARTYASKKNTTKTFDTQTDNITSVSMVQNTYLQERPL